MRSIALATLAVGGSAYLRDRSFYEAKFVDWLQEHQIELKNGAEFVHRLGIFASNDDFINEENAKGLSYTVGHNKYSMYTNQEFIAMMGLDRPMPERPAADAVHDDEDVSAAPASVDWVSAGSVTGVKDQGQCGSCWSFSTTGSLEGIYHIRNKKLVSFSEQQLVSCNNSVRTNHGCNGGLMDAAFEWIQENGGLCTEGDYPYTSGTTGQDGTCSTSCKEVSGSRVAGYTDVKANSESSLQTAVAQQPVSVAIDAASLAFQLYNGGVFTKSCGTNLDHGVLAVGYGTDSASRLDYWKVKNSWGTSWGEGGYIRMERNVSGKEGKCGIAMMASYPRL